jgi:hypothetical protein
LLSKKWLYRFHLSTKQDTFALQVIVDRHLFESNYQACKPIYSVHTMAKSHVGQERYIMKIHPDLLATQSYVNGQWQSSDATFDVTNPFNGECVAQIANGTITTAEQSISTSLALL